MEKSVLLFLASFSAFCLIPVKSNLPAKEQSPTEISRKALLTIGGAGAGYPDEYAMSERSLLELQEKFFKEGGSCSSLLASLDVSENPDVYEFPPLDDLLISMCATKLQRDFGKELSVHLEKSPVPAYFCRRIEMAKHPESAVQCRKINSIANTTKIVS